MENQLKYLTLPRRCKVSFLQLLIKFVIVLLKGWRNSMEDAHISDLKFDKNTELFAVFDGHGGNYFLLLSLMFFFYRERCCRILLAKFW